MSARSRVSVSTSTWPRALGIAVILVTFSPVIRTDRARADDQQESAKKKSEPKEGRKGKKVGDTDIDPELRKQIDDLLKSESPARSPKKLTPKPKRRSARSTPAKSTPKKPRRPTPARSTPTSRVKPGRTGAGSGATTPINLAPTQTDVPPEERTYSFGIKNGTYSQLIESVHRQTGLGVIGEAPRDGKVNFVTEEELTFDDMLARVRVLLFKYKPHEPYFLRRRETHLEVMRVTDLYRDLERWQMHPNVASFRAANLSDSELALVVYTPKTGSISDLTLVRDHLPDYVRVTPLEDRNAVAIFALVSDIKKYLWLADFFGGRADDIRELEVIPIHFISPSDALEKLRTLMELDGAARMPRSLTKRRDISPLAGIAEPEASIVPDDARGVLIVRAMADKIAEMKELLPIIDVDVAETYLPVVIQVKNTNPDELVDTVQQILDASPKTPASTPSSTPRSSRRSKKLTSAKSLRPVTVDQITLIAHPSTNAIIVMAPDDDVRRVRDLIHQFDVKAAVRNVHIEVKYTDPADISSKITDLLAVGAGKLKGRVKASLLPFQLVMDTTGRGLWFNGGEQDLAQVRELVEAMDVPQDAPALHIYETVNQEPSFIADILEQYEISGGSARQGKARRSKPRRAAGKSKTKGSAEKFTPNDEQGRLFVLCTDTEWEQFLPIIKELDQLQNIRSFELLLVEHITPAAALEKLTALMEEGSWVGKKVTVSSFRFETTEDGILVMGAKPSQLTLMRTLLAQFDRPLDLVQRTFEIKHTAPGDLRDVLESLMTEGPAGQGTGKPLRVSTRGKKAGATAVSNLRMVELGKRLVVRTTPKKMERVAALIKEFDVEEDGRSIRVYDDFPRGADLDAIAETLASMHDGTARTGKPRKRTPGATQPGAPQFLPQPAAGRLIVIADTSQFEQIEELIPLLRHERLVPDIVIKFIDVVYGDPAELVNVIDPLLKLQVRRLIDSGELRDPGQQAGSGAKAIRAKVLGKTTGMEGAYHMMADERNKRIVIAAPSVVVEEALDLVAAFDKPGSEPDQIEFAFVAVKYADPTQLIEIIDPLLSMKVHELVVSGKLAEEIDESPAATKPSVRRPSKGTRTARSDKRYHLAPDEPNSRIVIAGAKPIIKEATALIHEFDKPVGETELIFTTVEVHNASVSEMVKTIREMMGTAAPASRHLRGKQAVVKRLPASLEPSLTIAEAPGQPAVILRGPAEQVEQATEWIHHLDKKTGPGRVFKVYAIKHADIKKLVDMIMNVVDRPAQLGGRGQTPKARPRARALESTAEEDPIFTTSIERVGIDVYIQADLIENTMVVAASPAKIAEVNEIVERFDTEDPDGFQPSNVPKFMYPLEHKAAFDAYIDLEMVLQAIWEPSNELPQVDYAPFGEFLIVKYPHKDRFDEIRELIAKYVDRPKPGDSDKRTKVVTAIPRLSAMKTARLLQMNNPDLDIEVIDVTPPGEEYSDHRVNPLDTSNTNPCAWPLAFHRAVQSLLGSAAVGLEGADETEAHAAADEQGDQGETPPKSKQDEATSRDSADGMLRDAARSLLAQPGNADRDATTAEKPADRPRANQSTRRKALKIYVNNKTGAVTFEGPASLIDTVPDMIEELKEEIKDLPTPPDIRVYRMRYIDVYTAQDIIEEMFNATRQQRASVQRQQQIANQQRIAQQRRQQQQRQRQQQQKGQQKGQPARGSQPRPAPVPTAQLPQATVRVYPNPRDRSLILRADTSQFPALLELLATIDQPKPLESTHRVYQLKKLNATDVEELLTDWLGLDDAPARRTPSRGAQARRGAQAPGRAGPGSQLPQTLLQPSQTGAGDLGIDPQDIKLSSNAANNTILVMAPKVALDYVGTLIEELEGYDIAERVWKSYVLKHANVEEVADYLQSRYQDTRADTTKKRGKGEKGKSAITARSLATATFISYPRRNMISAQATEEQLVEIDELIVELDVAGTDENFLSVKLLHADAKIVADLLSSMFGGTAQTGRRGKKGASGAKSGAKFLGDEGGRIVFYSVPERLHDKVLNVIDEVEAQWKDRTSLHIVELVFAKPSRIAEAIESAYGRSARGSKGRPSSGGAAALGQVTVTASDETNRLFVMADNATFAEIESLIESLDKERSIGFEFRIFPLQHASARKIHETMTNLITEYMKRAPRDTPLEPFSVEVDDKANALIVLGSPVVFGFVEGALEQIDTPQNAASPPGLLMIPLRTADAQELAQNITRLWADKGLTPSEPPPTAEANRATNTLIVRGTQDQLDEINKNIVEPLEGQTQQGLVTEVISLKFAQAGDVANLIVSIFENRRRAEKEAGQGKPSGRRLDSVVAVTPDVSSNQLIVQASAANLAFVKERIAQLDREDIASLSATTTKIYPVDHADLSAVVSMVKEWAQSRSGSSGSRQGTAKPGDLVLAIPEPGTRSVVITASEANHTLIADVLDRFNSDEIAGRQLQTKSLRLKKADPGVVQEAITKLFGGAGRNPLDKVTAVADWGSNSVLVSASPTNLKRVKELIAGIDSDEVAEQQVRVVKLVNTDASSVAKTLNDIFIRPGARQGPGQLAISISALQGSKAILIKAKPEDFAEIEAAVAELDREGTVIGEEVRAITLLYSDATEMREAMQKYLEKPGGAGGGTELAGDTRISVLTQSNSLVVSGEKDTVERLESLISKLDAEGERGSVPQIIPLKHARATQVLAPLKEMFGEKRRGKGKAPPVIVADEVLNLLIVRGGPTDVTAIESIVARLDTEDAADRPNFRLVAVGQGINVTHLAETVEHSINEGARKQPGARGDREVASISVTPDPRTGTLIVSGSPSLFSEADKLVQALVKMRPSGERVTRVIRTSSVRVEEIQRLIEQLTGQRSGGSRRPRASSRSGSRSGSGGSRRSSRPRSRPPS